VTCRQGGGKEHGARSKARRGSGKKLGPEVKLMSWADKGQIPEAWEKFLEGMGGGRWEVNALSKPSAVNGMKKD